MSKVKFPLLGIHYFGKRFFIIFSLSYAKSPLHTPTLDKNILENHVNWNIEYLNTLVQWINFCCFGTENCKRTLEFERKSIRNSDSLGFSTIDLRGQLICNLGWLQLCQKAIRMASKTQNMVHDSLWKWTLPTLLILSNNSTDRVRVTDERLYPVFGPNKSVDHKKGVFIVISGVIYLKHDQHHTIQAHGNYANTVLCVYSVW
jgi:hypothetical protein